MSLHISIEEKRYDDQLVLKNIDLRLYKNNIYGLVGKNGQGKTTFFQCVLSHTDFKGSILYEDEKIPRNDIAWCPTAPDIYDDLMASEFKDFYAELMKLERRSCPSDLFQVPQNKLIKEFSTGMKKKAYLNAVFQKEFPVYILDEPFNGLDIESNYALTNYLKAKSKNSIVIISSHTLDSLYSHCNSIFLIQNTEMKAFEKQNFEKIEGELFHKS